MTSNTGVMIKKRPLPFPKFRLTNCQWIDCVSSSHNSTSSSNNISSQSSSSSSQTRYQARNVCWNASGSLLAVGCSDSMIRFWNPMSISFDSTTTTNTANTPCKEVGSINTTAATTSTTGSNYTNNAPPPGHHPPIIAATFHPTSDPILCSMTAGNGTLHLWDVRGSTSSSNSTTTASNTSTNNITTSTNITSSALSHCTIMTSSSSSSALPIVVAVEWNPVQTHMISCTTHDGTVSIYDTRKFTNHTTTSTNTIGPALNHASALVQKIQFPYNDRIESCIFDPVTGNYIIAGVTNRGSNHHQNNHPNLSSSSSGMGYIKACPWGTTKLNNENSNGTTEGSTISSTQPQHSHHEPEQWYAYPAHAGPIYTIASSHRHHRRNGGGGGTSSSNNLPKIATGGSDAVVGVWDVSTMTCTSTISSRTKFIRALAFSYPNNDSDPLLLAIATEEDVIELIDCSTVGGHSTCNSIGCANLSNTSSIGRRSMMSSPGIMAGAEDICFHPTIPNLLACARTSEVATPSGMSSVTLLKFTISSTLQ
jgi:WD40 repeat protein